MRLHKETHRLSQALAGIDNAMLLSSDQYSYG
jgi:hypothetical protein